MHQLSDWYGIPRTRLEECGGKSLFKLHSSLESLLRVVYPDFDWQSSRFHAAWKMPSGYWSDSSNVMKALDKAEATIGIKQVSNGSMFGGGGGGGGEGRLRVDLPHYCSLRIGIRWH